MLLAPISTVARTVSLGNSLRMSPTGLQHSAAVNTPTQLIHALSAHRRTASLHDGAGLGVHFRLYKYDSGNMQRVAVEEERITKAFAGHEEVWERVLDPATPSFQRDVDLAELLDLPTNDITSDPSTPKNLQKHYSGVYFVNAPQDQPKTEFVPQPSRFATQPKGDTNTTDYRLFVQKADEDGKIVSPWHDIPLRNEDGTLNFVCEIPKDTSAKFEVSTGEGSNPIKQDIKKGKLRFYPYNIHWNYGMLPQTWEDPAHAREDLGGIKGDNDPVDVVEIGSTQCESGGIYPVKALGAYAMVDDGELDWKILCIRADDPLAPLLNDIEDIERELPGELERVMVWFRDYKIPDGKPANAFGYDSQPVNSEMAQLVISETHGLYNNLKTGTRINDRELALA